MKVKVYSAQWCPFCKMVEAWLNEKKIPFEHVDVDEHPEAADYIIKKTGQTAIPVIEVDDQFVVGFDQPALKKALKME